MLGFSSWLVIPAAFFLDMVLGDPEHWPHPVRFMGLAISRLEKPFRNRPLPLVVSGALFTFFLVVCAFGACFLLVWAAGEIHPAFRFLVESLILYFCLAVRSLDRAALGVEKALEAENLQLARRKVGYIVSRDTSQLDEAGVTRATIETVSENYVDGVLSPLFFAALGGAPLVVAFKMASTLDSMVGYKNPSYERFGKASARLDDVGNFIPARLSVPFIALAAHFLGKRGKQSLQTAFQDGKKSASPNAGKPEAAFSGALGVRLAGPGVYHGSLVDKPVIGEGFPQPGPRDIQRARTLLNITSLLSAVSASGVLLLFC